MDDLQKSNPKKYVGLVMIIIVLLILIGGLVGWFIGRESQEDTTQQTETQSESTESPSASAGNPSELVNYTLPNGWAEKSCNDSSNVIYFVPNGEELDCSDEPEFAITLSEDPQNRTDCNQLQNVQNVSRHVCRSIFIDNHKTLEASTTYTQDSGVLPGRTVDAYYMDTGKGVALLRYIHLGEAEHGTGFNDLLQSLTVKN